MLLGVKCKNHVVQARLGTRLLIRAHDLCAHMTVELLSGAQHVAHQLFKRCLVARLDAPGYQDGDSGPIVSMQDLPKGLLDFYSMLLENKYNNLQDKLQANQE